jgi:hypothetical protein
MTGSGLNFELVSKSVDEIELKRSKAVGED